jgi:hypothetical protein
MQMVAAVRAPEFPRVVDVLRSSSQWDGCWPSGEEAELLEEWAFWYRGITPSGNDAWLTLEQMKLPHARDYEPPARMRLVNEVIREISRNLPDYRKVLKHFYLGGRHPREIAPEMGRTEAFVFTMLNGATKRIFRCYKQLTESA